MRSRRSPACPARSTPRLRAQAQALAETSAVDYPAVWALKSRVLAAHFSAFEQAAQADCNFAPARDFDAFLAEGGARLQLFAAFESLARRGKKPPQSPDEVESFAKADAQDIRAICFEQWLCDRQLARAAARGKAAGLSLGLYRDLAVGAAPDGGEVRAERDLFMHGASVGAPPDPFAEGGQVWGLPPPNPLAMARGGYEAFQSLLRANMRHAGALRIDHVMALQRLFVVPEGGPALDGAYLSYPLDDLLGELALESDRARCLVIGEDLGTVPDGIREKLAAANVLSYRVLFFERWGDDFAPPSAYPRKALACASTHDLPTLVGWRQGADIEEKAALGLISPEAAEAESLRRQSDIARLMRALAAEQWTAGRCRRRAQSGLCRGGPRLSRENALGPRFGPDRRPARRDQRGQPAGHRPRTPQLATQARPRSSRRAAARHSTRVNLSGGACRRAPCWRGSRRGNSAPCSRSRR